MHIDSNLGRLKGWPSSLHVLAGTCTAQLLHSPASLHLLVTFCTPLYCLQFIFRNPAWSTWAVLFCLPWKTTIGFSNMRGPAGSWSLSGYPVVRIHNGVQPMAFGCFVSLFSYADTLTFTHTCYSSKTENPQVRTSACADFL